MSKLLVDALRHTGASSDGVTFDNSGNVTFPGNTTITGTATVGGTTNLTITDGDLVIGTIGHGINFSATADGTTKTSELLDDYEEGTWVPAVDATYVSGTPTYHNQIGRYTRIGRIVLIEGYCHFNSISFSNNSQIFKLTGLPFNATSGNGVTGSAMWQQLEWVGASQSSYGTDNDVQMSPGVVNSNKINFKTGSQDKYYVSELKNEAVDGNQALFEFSFSYTI